MVAMSCSGSAGKMWPPGPSNWQPVEKNERAEDRNDSDLESVTKAMGGVATTCHRKVRGLRSASALTSVGRVNVSAVFVSAEPGKKWGSTQMRLCIEQKVKGKEKAKERPFLTDRRGIRFVHISSFFPLVPLTHVFIYATDMCQGL